MANPRSKLRRTWPYYYDPDSHTIWCRTMEDQVFTVHPSVSSSTTRTTSHPTCFHHQPAIQSSLVSMILPANSVPVQCTETWNTIIDSGNRLHQTPTAGFLRNLPPWQFQCLHQLTSEHSHCTILTMLEQAENTTIIASDGSVRQNMDRGTFAWVLVVADVTPWLKCMGPVGGLHVDMSRCPTCKAQEETYDHFLQCDHSSRVGWKSALRTDLLKYTQETHCHVIMQDILITGIHHWLHQLPFPTHRFPHHWHKLITSQSNIGWKQLLLGRFSTKWTVFQCQHLQRNHLTLSDFNHGPIWLSKIVIIT
jgi:hypothetical protein